MKLASRLRGRRPPSLMLTPLIDMFTIILIFLIVSFSAEDYDLRLDPQVTLPQSASRSQFKPSINLTASAAGVSVEGQPVVVFRDGRPDARWVEAGEIPELVAHLGSYYDALVKPPVELTREQIEAGPPIDDEAFVVTVQADRSLDYASLYLILRSTAKAGFFRYRVAVLKR